MPSLLVEGQAAPAHPSVEDHSLSQGRRFLSDSLLALHCTGKKNSGLKPLSLLLKHNH